MSRYLTDEEKERTLRNLREYCQRAPAIPNGGTGLMDAPFILYLEQINALAGVCTFESCIGHLANEHESMKPGRLWLRLAFWFKCAFDLQVATLVNHPNIERVSTIYFPGGEDVSEVLAIEFAGDEQGKFKESIGFIVGFLRSLSF